jgi:phytoene dehydrogenase-like protein
MSEPPGAARSHRRCRGLRDGVADGLLIERPESAATRDSFRALTGSDAEYDAWRHFYGQVGEVAEGVAPELTQPLPREAQVRGQVDPALWRDLVERPLGEAVERRFRDETVRGVVATDALIGTFARISRGVDTGRANVLLCGSGATRGGAVSGLDGHNAAQAVPELA